MAPYLATLDLPRLVLCSAGLRARQTLAAVLPSLGSGLEIRVEPELYTFDADVLLARLRRLDDDVTSVMLVGHNPALEELAMDAHHPTASSASGSIRSSRRERSPRSSCPGSAGPRSAIRPAGLTRFVTPRDLGGATPPSSTAPTG